MDRNQGNQGGRSGSQSDTDRKGGGTGSRGQARDDHGQSSGSTDNRGGSSVSALARTALRMSTPGRFPTR